VTFEQFIADVPRIHNLLKHEGADLRYGQTFYNHLHSINEPLAQKICGTHLDPFYKETVDSETIAFCAENWNWTI
jgi:trans-aconitate methyltransferase